MTNRESVAPITVRRTVVETTTISLRFNDNKDELLHVDLRRLSAAARTLPDDAVIELHHNGIDVTFVQRTGDEPEGDEDDEDDEDAAEIASGVVDTGSAWDRARDAYQDRRNGVTS